MNNYDFMRKAAESRFCSYDIHKLAQKQGVTEERACLSTVFLGERVEIHKNSGICTFPKDGRPANFGETLTVLDWLCDSKENAQPSFEFCPVTSLSRVFVSGSGLTLSGDSLAEKIERDPEAFHRTCQSLGGTKVPQGDIGYQLNAFPNLPFQLKFYHSDEDFPPSLQFQWDKHTLQFIRYETVYYLAGCVLDKLKQSMS
jgi:hypothetical protein